MRVRLITVLTVVAVGLLIAAPAAAAAVDVTGGDVLVLAVDGEMDKRQLPVDLSTPYGLFGAFLILTMVAAGVLGLRTAMKNYRGERPQADGSWRWR